MKILKIFFIATVLMITLLSACTYAATFEIQNNCSDTVWAAAVPGGGRKLYSGETWTLEVANGTAGGRIWARTNCTFNANGRGSCQTGDCGGLLECTAYGTPPITLAEYALNQFNNLDFLDISLVDGFNVPMKFSRPSESCTGGISCSADINEQCPDELRAPGGCNNPCTVFKTDQYCCVSGGNCGPTNYSRFFKERCPDAYSYPKDDQTSTFTCPGGSNYRVVFCPETFRTFTTFQVRNECPYTVWAASVPVGGGQRLDSGQTWTIQVPKGTAGGRIWARTNCTFNTNGRGSCQTGDCGGVLQCSTYGAPPNTLAEFSLTFNNLDFLDISLVDGFNVPIDFGAASIGCTSDIRCTADINGQCPDVLRAPGGCNNPCTVFKTAEYCCNSGSCGPTDYSRFFKDRCPDAYSYPIDDKTGAFSCPEGTNYWVVFCP